MGSYVFLVTLCTLLCFTSGLSATKLFGKTTEEDCGKSSSVKSRIKGGEEVERGEYPWMVSVQKGSGEEFHRHCGGSIIDENWIITAAHCLSESEPENYRAVVGLLKQSEKDDEGVEEMKISKIVVHEEFVGKENGFKDDIALMKTEEPIDFEGNEYVGTICLPDSDGEDPSGSAIVAGWGWIPEEEDYADILMDAEVPIVPREECKKEYRVVTETEICAGDENTMSCVGDSGGPLMEYDESGQRFTLIGIISHHHGCDSNEPGVFTKVASYVDWINEKKSE